MSLEVPGKKPSPLRHADIYAVLRRELEGGRFAVGGRFPSEDELQRRFQVGRHTARQALTALADDGYIDRRPKSGTIVLSTEPIVRFIQSIGTIENLFDFGIQTRLSIHGFGFVRLRDTRLCETLKLPLDERWLRIVGVRMQKDAGAPLCWTGYFIPPEFAIDRPTIEATKGPIYAAILRHHGLLLDHVDQDIGATSLSPALGKLLHAPINSPALTQVRRYFDSNGRLFQSTMNLYPAGRYFVRSRIEREKAL